METIGTRRVVRIGLTALLYTALTLLLEPVSFGSLQFRLAEVLMVLCLFSKDCIAAVTIGCFAANVFGPFGAADVIIGTLATLLSGILIYRFCRRLGAFGAALTAAAINAPAVSLVLLIENKDQSILQNLGQIAAGEFLVILIGGWIVQFHIIRLKKLKEFYVDKEPARSV